MAEFITIPEISVQEAARHLEKPAGDLVLLDVREHPELERVKLDHPDLVVVPLTELARHGAGALPSTIRDTDKKIVVICHHGNRSAQVTAWLMQLGYKNVYNMAGGVDAFAREVDSSIGFY